ncbi:transmembrane protein 30C [Tachysurus ichikawai]
MGKVKVGVGPFTRRPDNSAFKQQRLPAWSPSLTPHTVLPIFYSLSIVCVLLGVWLFITVQNIQQLKVSYSVYVRLHQDYSLCTLSYRKCISRHNHNQEVRNSNRFRLPDWR